MRKHIKSEISFEFQGMYGEKVMKKIFCSLVSCVDNASGMISDKERKISFAKQELYKLEWYGVEEGD